MAMREKLFLSASLLPSCSRQRLRSLLSGQNYSLSQQVSEGTFSGLAALKRTSLPYSYGLNYIYPIHPLGHSELIGSSGSVYLLSLCLGFGGSNSPSLARFKLDLATADRKVANLAQSSSRMGKDLAIGS
ncbi:sodium/hydrogen exchanger 8 [Striga asiatica]|uniref:Sodium/hydrogen exchanger 8 n=1 Tax=Striga asiatica TaxID=4170 RepID=A0A5A7PZE2_STRAF|nr:sodium/hydrogen exchanger 8 [Striga asiatica]